MLSDTSVAKASIPEEERLRRIVENVQRNFAANSTLTKNVTRALESTVMANPRMMEYEEEERVAAAAAEGFADVDGDFKNVKMGENYYKMMAEIREKNRQTKAKLEADKQTEFRKSGMAMNNMFLIRQLQNGLIRVSFLLAAVALLFFLNTMITINPTVLMVLIIVVGIFIGREVFFMLEGGQTQETSDQETIRGRGAGPAAAEGFEDAGDAEEEATPPKGGSPDETFVAEYDPSA